MNNVSLTYVATPIASLNVTSAITAVLATAGDGGKAVPIQPWSTSTQIGVRTVAGTNKVELFNHATQKKFNDGHGNEVYGKITESSWTYTLTFYSMINGTETAYSFTASVAIDCEFLYLFDLYRCPANTQYHVRRSYDDLSNGWGTLITEDVDVTALNTLADLWYTPVTWSTMLFVNHVGEDTIAPASFTVTGKALTWSSSNAWYDLDTTDKVTARYTTLEI